MRRLAGGKAVGLALTLIGAGHAPLAAQTTGEGASFLAACSGNDVSLAAVCGQAAGAAFGSGLALTLLTSGGALAPIPPSTLGKRLPDAGPRVAFAIRVSRAPLRAIAIGSTPTASTTLESGAWAFRITGASGLFDGFQPVPSVGGVLSLDAFATLDRLVLPAELVQAGIWSGSAGLRIGLLRESFTAPGISLDLSYGRTQNADLVDTAGGAVSSVQSRTKAARISVGKDLGGLGLVGGVGRNWTDLPTVFAIAAGGEGEISTTRDVLFGGVTLNFLVVQLNGELGWAGGRDIQALSDPLLTTGTDDFFGTLTVRFVF